MVRICAVGMAVLVPLAVQAHPSELTTTLLKTTIDDADYKSTYNVAVTCTDAVLVYGLYLFVPHNDPTDRYMINEKSIRLGDYALSNILYATKNDHMNINLLEGSDGVPYPLLIPRYSPLIIPIQVLDSTPGTPTEATLDMTYKGNPGTTCLTSEIRGPQKIGLMVRTSVERGMDRLVAANMAADDYNQYLKSIGEQWSLELVLKDSGTKPDVALQKVLEFDAAGIRLIIGPSSSGSIDAIREYTHSNGMLIISCCSTAPSLSLPDHIFRITPDDTNQAKALARIITDDGITSVVTVYLDGPYGRGLDSTLATEMKKRGGAVVAGIPYPVGADNYDGIAQDLADIVGNMTGAAVVAISSSEAVDLIESAMKHDVLGDTQWYGSEAVVNHRGISHGEVGAFAEQVGLTGAIVAVPSSPLKNDLQPRLAAELDLRPDESPSAFLYSVYDAIGILVKAMLATQSADTENLLKAIPYVAAHTHGVMPNTLNENGDLADSNYGVWEVKDMSWVRTGTFMLDTDAVVPYVP